jgi:hypothetical protein
MNREPELDELLQPSKLKLPALPRVLAIRAEPYVDWLGESELKVNVILDEKTKDKDRTWKRLEPIHEAVVSVLRSSGESRFPYVRFRKASELKARG